MKTARLLLWPGLATLVALALLLALGIWQIQRKAQKEDLLAALDRAATAEPLALDSTALRQLRLWPAGLRFVTPGGIPELTRAKVTGIYIPARSIPVRATFPAAKNARSLGGLGFFWMTPLQIDSSTIIFVNRGFVPADAQGKAPAIETPEGPQSITGLLRLSEKAQTFTPADNPGKGEYFIRDPQTMAKAVALRDVIDLFIDAERGSADTLTPPVGVEAQEMIARIPNNHLSYALTWFGLALTLLGVFGFFARARLRQNREA